MENFPSFDDWKDNAKRMKWFASLPREEQSFLSILSDSCACPPCCMNIKDKMTKAAKYNHQRFLSEYSLGGLHLNWYRTENWYEAVKMWIDLGDDRMKITNKFIADRPELDAITIWDRAVKSLQPQETQ